MTNELQGVIKRWWVALIFGILAIGLGILMFFTPVRSYIALSYVFAIYFIAYGLYKSIMVFKERDEIPAWGWSFALGIITFILGLILLIPGMAEGTFVYYVIFSVMFMGINSCSLSFTLKDLGDKSWGWTLAFGILTIILSFIMLFTPVFSMGVITYWFAALFIMLGIELCILAYRLSVAKSVLEKSGK